jgi:uncharacterized SAM-binding protein YcdF (DUF218 family)
LLSSIPFSNLLLYPPGLCLFLLALALVLSILKRRVTAVVISLLGLSWVIAWSLPVTSLYFGGLLESQHPYRSAKELPRADVIVVFGGNTQANRANWFEPYNRATAVDRIDRAEALYLAGRAPRILLSGSALEGKVSEAQIVARLLRQRGIPDAALILENDSRNTYENARFTDITMRGQKLKSALLVTSALHMPRALGSLEKRGIQVTAAGGAPQIVLPAKNPPGLWWPHLRSLEASRTIIKEYLGLFGYGLRGWL